MHTEPRVARVFEIKIVRRGPVNAAVTQLEVSEILKSKLLFRFLEKGLRPDENVYLALGRTEAEGISLQTVLILWVRKKLDDYPVQAIP